MSKEMKVGLISGTGEEGRAIALRLAASGISLHLGSRSAEKASGTAAELNQHLTAERVQPVENRRLVEACDLLLLTVPFVHAQGVIDQYRDQLTAEKIIVDVTVPVVFQKGPQLVHLDEGSGSEFLRRQIPAEVPVVAAFKTLPAHLLADLDEPLNCDEFLCSDSQEALEKVRSVFQKVPGVRWINAGPLKYARALEAMTFLAIGLNLRFKKKTARYQVLGLD